MSMKISIFKITVLISLTCLFGGCSSTTSNTGFSPRMSVYKGMPLAELLELASEPIEVRQVDPPRDGYEIWVYRRSVKKMEYSAVTTEETPYFDPLTGEYKPTIDAVLQPVRSVSTVESQILIVDGAVVSWKSKRDVGRKYE